MKIKFWLDENLSPRLQQALRRRQPEIDVLRVGDRGAPDFGTPDPEVLLYLEVAQRLLVTDNRQSMPAHLQAHWTTERHIWGLFWLRPGLTIGSYADELVLVWETSEAEEWFDQLAWLPL